MRTAKVYHAYRTTETKAFELIGVYPDCTSAYEVMAQLKVEGKWNRRHYFMVDHFAPNTKDGPASFDLDGSVSDALFPSNDSATHV